MSDKLVFDLSQEVEGSPNVFVRKDWVNILDNQNQNYNSNQSVIDTSQLSNSNKYMSYREAYLSVPLLLTIGSGKGDQTFKVGDATSVVSTDTVSFGGFAGPLGTGAASYKGADGAIGLKNWFGQIIHSMTLDYNGTTICQQTPYINMWNSFKLMTSLSLNDVLTQGCKIGFYPDDATSFQYFPTAVGNSTGSVVSSTPTVGSNDFIMCGVCNNTTLDDTITQGEQQLQQFNSGQGNQGLSKRLSFINFDGDARVSKQGIGVPTTGGGGTTGTYGSLLFSNAVQSMWKSHVVKKQTGTYSVVAAAAGLDPTITNIQPALFQVSVSAVIYLKHLHSFFNMCPLLKGVFMKLTLNLNNTSTSVVQSMYAPPPTGGGVLVRPFNAGMQISSVSNAIGGVNPLMISSTQSSETRGDNGGAVLASFPETINPGPTGASIYGAMTAGTGQYNWTYTANVSVGTRCLDSKLVSMGAGEGGMSQSIYLYVPAYTFNPEFEQAYLSTPVKQIKYTDVYQYQVQNIAANGQINSLITNGIANIKSILILPFFSASALGSATQTKSGVSVSTNTNILSGVPVYQSPFDPAGTGCTSPLCHLTNFNIQISGQNAIYNMQKYSFEQFNDQLYGQNAVNGGLTDGLTSSLIGRQEFDMEYCYYYVNVERMLPVEMAVPKSVQLIGQNLSAKAIDYLVFVEYGVEISIDVLTGSRV